MVDILSSNVNNLGISALFQPLSNFVSAGNAAIIQRSGATVFNYHGASSSERLAVRNQNAFSLRSRIESGEQLSGIGPSVTGSSNSTNELIESLQEQIADLRRQLGLDDTPSSSLSIFGSTGADNLINQRYHNTNQANYNIEIVGANSVAQEEPRNGTGDYDDFLVFKISRSGYTEGSSSVDYRFVSHLSTTTADDFTVYHPNNPDQFRRPTRNNLGATVPSGTVYFSNGETSKNITISINNDQVREEIAESLSIGLYKPSTTNLLDFATGHIEADKNKSLGTITPSVNYVDVFDEKQIYQENSATDYLRISTLADTSFAGLFSGQIASDQRVRIAVDIEYGKLDANDLSQFDGPSMTETQNFFISSNPNVLATSLLADGTIDADGPVTFSDINALSNYLATLAPTDSLGIMLTITDAEYVDATGADINTDTISSTSFAMDSVNLVVGGATIYNIETPAADTWNEGSDYEIVVSRDLATAAEDVEVTLAEIAQSPALATVFEAADTDGGDVHLIMFAVGELKATLTIMVVDDGIDENEEPFSISLTSFTGNGTAGANGMHNLSIAASGTGTPQPSEGDNEFTIAPSGGGTFPTSSTESDTLSFDITRTAGTSRGIIMFSLLPRQVSGRDSVDFSDIDPNSVSISFSNAEGAATRTINPALTQNGDAGSFDFAFNEDITNGDVMATVSIMFEDDAIAENSELFQVEFTADPLSGIINGNNSFEGEIAASDGPGNLTIGISANGVATTGPFTLNESDTTMNSIEFVIMRDFDADFSDVMFTITGTAEANDFEVTSTKNGMSVMINSTTDFLAPLFQNESEITIQITAANDGVTETDEDFTINLHSSERGAETYTGTIVASNPLTNYTLSTSSTNFNENSAESLEVVVMRDTTTGASSIDLKIDPLMGTDDSDFMFVPSAGVTENTMAADTYTIMFADGEDAVTVTLDVVDDNIDETGEQLSFELIATTGATVPTATTIDLIDDDAGKTNFSIASQPTSSSATEGASNGYEFIIERTGSGDTIDFALVDGGGGNFVAADIESITATATQASITGTDLHRSLMFLAGENAATITIHFADTDNDTGNETFNIALQPPSAPSHLDVNNNAINNITIQNDVPSGFALSGPTSVAENNSGVANVLVLTVENLAGVMGSVDVRLAGSNNFDEMDISAYSLDDTAHSIADFTTTPISVQFDAGDRSKNISITLSNDTDIETGEQLAVTLENAVGAAILPTADMLSVDVRDNDAEFTFEIREFGTTTSVTTLEEGKKYDLVVTRSGEGSYDITPNLIRQAGTDFDTSDFRFITPSLSFSDTTPDTQTATFELLNDSIVETESFNIGASLSNNDGGTSQLVFPTTPYTVTDTSTTPSEFTLSGPSFVTESDDGSTNVLVLMVENLAGVASSVDVMLFGGGGLDEMDVSAYSLDGSVTSIDVTDFKNSITVNFATGETSKNISITLNNDTDIETSEQLVVELQNASTGSTVSATDGMLTVDVRDNDAEFAFEIREAGAATPITTLEEGKQYDLVVTRTSGSGSYEITPELLGLPGSDFSMNDVNFLSSMNLSFSNTSLSSQTITFEILDDAVVENVESFYINTNITANNGGMATTHPAVTYAITDTSQGFSIELRDPLGASTTSVMEGNTVEVIIRRTGSLSAASPDLNLNISSTETVDANDFTSASINGTPITAAGTGTANLLEAIEATNINFAANNATDQTITLNLADDDAVDENWTLSLTSTSTSINTGTDTNLTVTNN